MTHADARQHRLQMPLLTLRKSALTQNETADMVGTSRADHRLAVAHAQEPISPLVGDDGSAE